MYSLVLPLMFPVGLWSRCRGWVNSSPSPASLLPPAAAELGWAQVCLLGSASLP